MTHPTHTSSPDQEAPPASLAPKSLLASKSLWFNAVLALLAGAEPALGVLQPVLGDHTYEVLCGVLAVGNALLRLVTAQPLQLRLGR